MKHSDHMLRVGDDQLECRLIEQQGAALTVVFLHEGLGSVALWKDFPARLCAALGVNGLIYSRMGYGNSTGLRGPRSVRFMHREAEVVLPQLLTALEIRRPVLFGHSDGGSIALLYAAFAADQVAAAVVLAPHVFVEARATSAIAAAREAYLNGDLRRRLLPFHQDVDGAFFGWNDIWLDPDFLTWNIEACLPQIVCPVLAIQGEDDEYGTMRQIELVEFGVRRGHSLKLASCRHSPHRDCAEQVIAATKQLLEPWLIDEA